MTSEPRTLCAAALVCLLLPFASSLAVGSGGGAQIPTPQVRQTGHDTVAIGVADCCSVRGDVDHDSQSINISDLVYLIDFMFRGGPEPFCTQEVDVDGDNEDINVSDLVYLIDFMFQGGQPPAPCLPSPSLVGDYTGTYTVVEDYGSANEWTFSESIEWSFSETFYWMDLDADGPEVHCFCKVDGTYEVAEVLQLSEVHAIPAGDAGCSSCNPEQNPRGGFSIQWIDSELVLRQLEGTTLKELHLNKQ